MLAVRIMQEQAIEVEALNFKTVFTCCQDQSAQAARELGVRLTVVGQEDDYLELVKRPRFGRGKGANPCVDCRIYMFAKAKRFMEQVGGQFIVSGEVVGQRPMSQKRRDLDVIARHAGLDDLLLRPLSAKLLPPTRPEREGLVDRERLYDFTGRSRKPLIELARHFGLRNIPTPSTGCALTEPQFSQKVFDLIQLDPDSRSWDFELLKVGRHFRFDERTKVVVGKNQEHNSQLEYLHELPDATSQAIFHPRNFTGPVALLIGPITDAAVVYVGGLLVRYAKDANPDNALVEIADRRETRQFLAVPTSVTEEARTLATALP
jgi:tRNA U34 2-thiouridine synthase MnmA/TrmU